MAGRYYVFVPKSVLKSIAKIPLPWRLRIKDAIDALEVDPYYGEKMRGKLAHMRKIRVWPYRIVYGVEEKNKMVKIFEVDHRDGMSYE